MNIAVLGCGPAGLMAALAVRLSGNTPMIYSRKRKSQLFGAQYLHKPIPGVTRADDFVEVKYILRGDVGSYRRKVYGDRWDGTVSPDELEETHNAWDIRETYDRLWTMFEDQIIDVNVDPAGINTLLGERSIWRVINTIPLNMLCMRGHTFGATKITAAGDAPRLGINVGRLYMCPPDTVVCNGEDSPSWYRMSNIFGHTTVEWPSDVKPPVTTASEVLKPTFHNCDCWPDLTTVGRYGSWSKGVLSHSAFDKTMEVMEGGKADQEATYSNPDVPTLF